MAMRRLPYAWTFIMMICSGVGLCACGGADDFDPVSAEDEADTTDGTDPGGKGDNANSTSTTSGSWQEFATGIGYRNAGTGDGIFLGYGGYGVKRSHAQVWVDELHRARLSEMGIGHLFAIKGPADPLYEARELRNSKIAEKMVGELAGAGRIVIAAHSSGSFVAHELLGGLKRRDPSVLRRVSYFDLDGGRSGLTDSIVSGVALVRFVYAKDQNMDDNGGLSRNGWAAKSYAEAWGRLGAKALEIDATGSGCDTKNCLHDAVIITVPHDSSTFDVANDYTDFNQDQAVVTTYLDAVP